jgi:hypothetical protein
LISSSAASFELRLWVPISNKEKDKNELNMPVLAPLAALMDLYIHPLKVIFYPSYHKIYSFLASIHPLSTVGPLVTLSKYIHVTSCFKVFITTNLMVQSKFNLVFWLVSYNIFFIVLQVGAALDNPLSPALHARSRADSSGGRSSSSGSS